ncbi:NAD-dependent epimerase/dehydratase family protein [Gluconacetobacter azotocaptans]|uniref:NAD-dependent epimerase/dehydratase family protein n=1 Tax=Gluconacetobacter azotocaptans TaxID=142834 RepID=A0A7W4PHV6_9PROT|nr:GMC oxidoreductase [Gluconacetobacter azotocaptans]MBB2191506.1 NAD-dependent epimerase/dehydratase family protein [Gluconacetobacter azotocaptans]GBQ32823.1 choline dehydrogenase [Gluconacetobacter azotocaptans DSM 13594]
MTDYIDFEHLKDPASLSTRFDLVIVGGGAAGLTLARELSGQGLRIAIVESGALDEDPDHEELNAIDVSGDLLDKTLQDARSAWHAPQMRFWKADIQKFGVRCRVLGGSTMAWAGKVAPFSPADYEQRPWVAGSGWPFGMKTLAPYMKRAATYLDLGPLVHDRAFWTQASRREPDQMGRLHHFGSFFWQFARSRHALTDVMRFGPDFRRETHKGVTVVYNATVSSVSIEGGKATGVELRGSLTGRNRVALGAECVVLAAGAIENARLLLMSRDSDGQVPGNAHDVVGRYLMDHPSIELGYFSPEHRDEAAALLGFFPLQERHRVFMYSHGLALHPEVQTSRRLPNMAIFTGIEISPDDSVLALKRLAQRQSRNPLGDVVAVARNFGLVATSLGRKILNYQKIPERFRRLIADAAVAINANFVARDYVAGGGGRKLAKASLNVICEQPPHPDNRVTLSTRTDRLGLPLARVHWKIDADLRRDIVQLANLLQEDLERAGIRGFHLRDEFRTADISKLLIHDMAHTAGTTRMGTDPATSVVDPDCQVHGVSGLFVAGASVFPTSGHANPTMVIMSLAIRLADHIKAQFVARRVKQLSPATSLVAARPLILVTGATGNLGQAVIARLAAGGYRIRGTFRHSIPATPGVEWVQIDFSDPTLPQADLENLAEGVEAVIHLAASLSNVHEMETTNVTNLDRFAKICATAGVRYFGQASSMVVYGSPRARFLSEEAPIINTDLSLKKQYFAEPSMLEYARSKVLGERVLSQYAQTMHIDLYRIAIAQKRSFLDESLSWSAKRAVFALYRNSHFISSRNVARAIVHLMERDLASHKAGVDIYNVADSRSPTYAEVYRRAGRKTGFHVPVVFDVLKGVAFSRTLARRFPMGYFRLDDRKLKSTGFVLEDDPDLRSAS